jgi:tetratricopeptide (TPR) repeat protein
MERRFEGFPAEGGLILLDTFTGEVTFVPINGITVSTGNIAISGNPPTQGITQATMTDFDREVCTTYPYPIAKAYADLLAENDPRQQCKLMVDTFTAVLKLMALQVASEYLRVKDLKDMQVNQTLKRDIQRPLISAWNNLLKETIRVLNENNIPFFSPELVRAYEILETTCMDKVFVEKHYEDNGQMVTKRTPLAKIQALIKYRNSLAHGFNQSRERALKELELYLPVLKDILVEVRYMSRYTLWHVSSKEDNVEGIRLMGSSPNRQMLKVNRSLLDPGISPIFLVNESTLEVLPMFTFLDLDISEGPGIAETGKDIFIFDGNTDSTVIYLSTSSGQHLEKKSRMKHWKELLKTKELELKAISEKDLDLAKISAMTSLVTEQTLQTLINSGKFIPEVTLKRDDLEIYLDQFLLGDYNAIVVGGESGIGKSTLLADKVREWSEQGNPVMFYKASSLNSPEIGQKFIRDLYLKVNYPEDFLSMVSEIMNENKKNFFLVIDAVNEFSGDVNMLINAIESLVAQASPYRWFRIILTVRDSSYNRAHARFGSRVSDRYFSIEINQAGEKTRSLIIPLNRLNENTVERIYEKYRSYALKDSDDPNDPGYHIFRPLNSYVELDSFGTTAELMKSPLMMRLILQAFNRKELPSNLSTDSAMQIYLDEVVVEKNNPNGSFPARRNFLSALVKIMDKAATDTAGKDQLLEAPALKEAMMNPQKDSPYVQLLELGVLMEEWEDGECYVRFSFDRLFEFLLAEEHFKRTSSVNILKELMDRSKVFRSMEGALQIIMTRLTLNGERSVIIELIDNLDPEEERSIQLVVGFMKTLFYIDREAFHTLIKNLPEDPTRSDLKILSELILSDLVFTTEEKESYLNIMLDVAKNLNNLHYQADALCLLGNHLRELRESEKALTKYEEAKTLFESLDDLNGLARTYNLIARCQMEIDPYYYPESNELDHGPIDQNYTHSLTEDSLLEMVPENHSWLESINKALDINKSLVSKDAKKRTVQNLINKAIGFNQAIANTPIIIFGFSDDELEVRSCRERYVTVHYQEALSLSEEIDYKEGLSTIYNNLAANELDQSNYQKAADYLVKGMAINEKIGNSNGLGYNYWNLAVCNINLNQIDVLEYFKLRIKAAEYFKRSGYLMAEIEHLESFISPLRYSNSTEIISNEAKQLINHSLPHLIFDLSNRWFGSLITSTHKSGISDGDSRIMARLFEILFEIPWFDLKIFRKILLQCSSVTQFMGIYSLFETERVKKKLELSAFDPDLLNTFTNMSIETLHAFEREDERTSEEDFEEMKSAIKKLKLLIQSILEDNWEELYQLSIFEISKEAENYSHELANKLLKNLSWCKDIDQSKKLFDRYKKEVSDYLKRLKKDNDKSVHYSFEPEAILILGKLIPGKKVSEKEIQECVSHFNLIYVDEFPLAFFYRLIVYLNEHNETELLKEVLQKLDEQDLRFPEVWPRSGEMKKIRERVESQTGV